MLRNLKKLKHFLINFLAPVTPTWPLTPLWSYDFMMTLFTRYSQNIKIFHKCHVSGVLMTKSGWNWSKHVEAIISLRSVARRKKGRRKKKRVITMIQYRQGNKTKKMMQKNLFTVAFPEFIAVKGRDYITRYSNTLFWSPDKVTNREPYMT